MNNKLLNNIATQIVMDKVMDDKMKDFEKKQEDDTQENQVHDLNKDNQINEDDDDIFKIDEDEQKLVQELKEQRLMQQGIKPKQRDRSVEKKQSKFRYGEYREIEESEFLDTLLKNEKVVCHFYHSEFEKCKIMDKHLIKVSFDHRETLFVKINAEKAPFFCTKLNIQVLPTVIFSKGGKVFERIIGFEGLEGTEDFNTITLLRKLVMAKMIVPKNKNEKGEIKMKKKTKLNSQDSESEEEEDDYDC
ncbi:MAG: thioredoxin domain-containing protein [bacterium]